MSVTHRICAAVLLLQPVGSGPARAQPDEPPAAGQATLDRIASLPFAAPALSPPGPFSRWSAADQVQVPARITRSCLVLWTMAHDAPGARVLPPSSSGADEGAVGLDVCVAGHLPADWPGRAARIADARAILARAAAHGSTLTLPPTLRR